MPQKLIRKINLRESQLMKDAVGTPKLFSSLDSTLEFNIAKHFPTALVGANASYPVPNKLSNLFDNTTSTQARFFDGSVGKVITGSPAAPNVQTTTRKGYLIFDFGRKINPRKFEIILNDNSRFINDNETANGYNPDRGVRLHFQNAVDELGLGNSGGNGTSGTNATSLQYKDNDDFTTETIPVGTAPYKITSSTGFENIIGDNETYDVLKLTIDGPELTSGLCDGFQFLIVEFRGSRYSYTFDVHDISLFEEVDPVEYNVEFDDALLGLKGWKNPRYEGSKLTGTAVNKFVKGDISYGKNPVVEKRTTAIYIANTCIGAEDEDPQFAFIQGHSYIGIDQILVINPDNDQIQILSKDSEDFDVFQKFITSDFPTGGKLQVRILDNSVMSSLKENYFVKFNKGKLLSSFRYFDYDNRGASVQSSNTTTGFPTSFQTTPTSFFNNGSGGNNGGITSISPLELSEKADAASALNSVFQGLFNASDTGSNSAVNAQIPGNIDVERLYFRIGAKEVDPCMTARFPHATGISTGFLPGQSQQDIEGSDISPNATFPILEGIYGAMIGFQYTYHEMLPVSTTTDETFGGFTGTNRSFGPSYVGARVKFNKFTKQYYSGSYKSFPFGKFNSPHTDNSGIEAGFGGAFHQASKFILQDTINFLKQNQTTTELHLTLMSGSIDFAPGFNDERSISTFEVNPRQTLGGINSFTGVNDYHYLELKSRREDGRFMPKISQSIDLFNQDGGPTFLNTTILNNVPNLSYPFVQESFEYTATGSKDNPYIPTIYEAVFNSGDTHPTITGLNTNAIRVHGIASNVSRVVHFDDYRAIQLQTQEEEIDLSQGLANEILDKIFQKGITYELSFLDKSPTIIVDIDKNNELFDGIGKDGIILIPEFLDGDIKKNINFYLKKAGLIGKQVIKSPPRPERGR
jgi:hypothetical protein